MKAQYTVTFNGQEISQATKTKLSYNGKVYLYRGCKDGKTLAMTLSGNSAEWVHIPATEVKGIEVRSKSELKQEAKPMAQKKATQKTVTVTHGGYSKQKGLDMNSMFIKAVSKKAVCSYNMWYMHLQDNKDGTLLAHGEKNGKTKKSVYTEADIQRFDGLLVVICKNSSGDKVEWIHDFNTNETALVVLEKAQAQSADLC